MPAPTVWQSTPEIADAFLITRAAMRSSVPLRVDDTSPRSPDLSDRTSESLNRQTTAVQSPTLATAPRFQLFPTRLQVTTKQSPTAAPSTQSTLEQWFSIANLQAIKRVIVDLF